MIYLQPDIIAQRLSSHRGSIPIGDDPGPQSQETAKLTMRNNGQLFDEDLVTRQQQYWTSSPSWIRFFLGSLQYHIRSRKQNNIEGLEVHAQYTLAPWFCSLTLDTRFQNLSGWQFNLRTYRRSPYNSEFFILAAKGDVAGLQRMLGAGQALITDREAKHGQTALDVSPLNYARSKKY
jgi:hypothetical protein